MSESPISLRDETGVERFRGTQSPGGGSLPGALVSKDVLLTEDDTSTLYSGSVAIPAGAVVTSVEGTPLAAPWAADGALLNVGDTLNGSGSYFPNVELGGGAPVPTCPITGLVPSGPYNIVAVNQGAQTFTLAGDHTALSVGVSGITVSGSTGNDGAYNATSLALVGGNTVVTVVEAIPDGTADGAIDLETGRVAVAGDHTYFFFVGTTVTISGSTNNDGASGASVDAVSFDGTHTQILLSATLLLPADGTITPNVTPSQTLSAPYDPASVSTANAVNLYNIGAGSYQPAFAANGGNGIPYEADDAITVTVNVAGPSGTPAGQLLVKVSYYTPQTPAAPVLS